MLHTKLSGNQPAGSREEDFERGFATYGRGGHLGHVTSIMSSDTMSLYLKTSKKIGSDRHSSLRENQFLIFVCTQPWAKVKK